MLIWALAFFALIPCVFAAHRFTFDKITIEDGLSQSSGLSMVQDTHGFMWIGTEDGLNRYDGYDFKIYKNNEADDTSIAGNWIIDLFVDSKGNLWIGTDAHGLSMYVPETDTFINNLHNPRDSSTISSNAVTSITEDREGFLWAATEDGLNRFDTEKRTFQRFTTRDGLSSNSVLSVLSNRRGDLWTGGENGILSKLDEDDMRFESIKIDDEDTDIVIIAEDKEGFLWLGSGNGLYKFNPLSYESVLFRHDPEDSDSLVYNDIQGIVEDNDGRIWIGTDGGLSILDSGKFHTVKSSLEEGSLINNFIRSITKDKMGIIWIGTFAGGINRYDPSKMKFGRYPSTPENPYVWSILEDGNVVWIGTSRGLLKYDEEAINFEKMPDIFTSEPDNPDSLSGNWIWGVAKDKQGRLWLGTSRNGVTLFDPEKNTFKHYRHNPEDENSLSGDRIYRTYVDSRGNVWIGTRDSGLNMYNPDNDNFIRYAHSEEEGSISDNWIVSMYDDYRGLWVGTDQGLNLFDYETKSFRKWLKDPDNPESLSNNRIMCVNRDSKGILWIGTHDGLNKLDEKTEKFKVYSTKDGLPNEVIYSVLEDAEGYLWLTTNYGMARFDTENETSKNYKKEDGLQNNEFNVGAFYKGESGKFYFGGIEGFNAFFPRNIMQNPYVPDVVITKMELFNKEVPIGEYNGRIVLPTSITEIKEIVLSYTDVSISFEFAGIHYSAPERNEYAYLLEGFDKEWNYIGNRRFITFTNLPDGEYTLKVKAANADGLWNEIPKELKITIVPPIWNTLWFRVYRTYSIKQRSIRLEAMVKERTREVEKSNRSLKKANEMKDLFTDILRHDILSPIIVIKTQTELLGRIDKKNPLYKSCKMIRRNVMTVENIIRAAADYSKIADVKKLDKEDLDVRTLIAKACDEIKEEYLGSDMEIMNKINIKLPFKANIMLQNAFLNILSNAFKYAEEGKKVIISAKLYKGDYYIKFTDFGKGIEDKYKESVFVRLRRTEKEGVMGLGLGLAITKKIIELHNGKIWIEDNPKGGAVFVIRLPR
jgi:ligand-binding sensor domain-containing protein/signal transduction histidine kinase